MTRLFNVKTKIKDKVNVITLGCSKNLVDSEVLVSQLKGNNITTTHQSNDKSNIIIINTCGFIDNAKQESIDTILRFARQKTEGNIKKLFVTGCLSERYKDDLKEQIPEVDGYFGTRDLPLLLKRFNATYKKELLGERNFTTTDHFAYMKISEGCDRPCSFCAIPLMRGKHISRPIEELVIEAKHLAVKGTKELILIAQDSTYYGLDIYKKRKLAELLDRLSETEGIEWIRLHYAFPTGFPMDILKVMNEKSNICKYIDIPLQHGSTNILQSMSRGTTREKQEELINRIRGEVDEISIRTTLIAGYPGETENDFEQMYEFVEKMRFERLGVFTYSHEQDTKAFKLNDDVPQNIKNQRASKIMELQESISWELNQQKIGMKFKTLIDRVEGDYFIGRTEFDSPEVDNEVIIRIDDDHLRIGDFSTVCIDRASEFDLYGSLCK